MTELREPTRTVDAARAVTLVDAVQGLIKGWHFIWGSPNGENGVERDSFGTWFDKARPPNYSAKGSLVGYPICVEHGLDPVIDGDAVAVITRNYFDDVGLAFEAQLDRSHPAYERTLSKIQRGDYKTSSSSAEHMAKFYDDGAFRNWMHTETSLVENPSQAEMPAVSLVRSTGISGAEDGRDARRASSSGITNQERNTMLNQLPVQPSAANAAPPAVPATRTVEEELAALVAAYGVEAVKAALDAMQGEPGEMPGEPTGEMPMLASEAGRSAFLSKLRSQLEAQKKESELVTLRARLDAIEAAHKDKDNAPPPVEPRAVRGVPAVVEARKFWRLNTANDAMFAYQVMRSQRIHPSADFMQAMAKRVESGMAKGEEQFDHPAFRSAMPYTRANEIATSTAATGGDEWVGIGYSANLWEKARDEEHYQELISRGMVVEEIDPGEESTYISLEGSDPVVYTISQPTDLDATSRPTANVGVTRIGTDRILFTPKELGMAVAWTDVFEEDSIIKVASQYNRQMEAKARETVFQLFLNGDTVTGTTNINYDDGTPGTGLSTPYYIASNGAIKYALVTGSSTSRDGGSLDENDYRLTMKLMPSTIRARIREQMFFIDTDTHSASLNIAAVKTDDVRRTNATITSGVLTNIYGVDVFQTGLMLLAAADGKVTYNVAGTLGRLLDVYAPYWAVAWKRQLTIESDRDIIASTNIVVAKWRLGFVPRGAGASTISYNITV